MSIKECPAQSQVQKLCFFKNKLVEGTKSVQLAEIETKEKKKKPKEKLYNCPQIFKGTT